MGVFILQSGGGIDGARLAPEGYDARKGTYIVYYNDNTGLDPAVLTYEDGVLISSDGWPIAQEYVRIVGRDDGTSYFVGFDCGTVIKVDD